MAIIPKVIDGTATPEEVVRGLMIMSPSLREQIESFQELPHWFTLDCRLASMLPTELTTSLLWIFSSDHPTL